MKNYTRLRRATAALGLTVVLGATTGCTQEENFLWSVFHHEAPAEAQAMASTLTPAQVVDGVPVLTPEQLAGWKAQLDALIARTPCERYDDWSASAGLPPHFQGVMRRESGCDPNAHNPSGASGLYQVMPMWADDCGTTHAGLFDPWTNILCAVHIYAVQGGGAWTTW